VLCRHQVNYFRARRHSGTVAKVSRRTTSDIICSMPSRASQLIVALVLFTCLVCPLVEIFDQWDHTIQTGNDTEYTFVVLGLCVGVAYAFARFVFGFPLPNFARRLVSNLCTPKSLSSGRRASFFFLPIPLSPPVLALRI
jgi:hypothetical protein